MSGPTGRSAIKKSHSPTCLSVNGTVLSVGIEPTRVDILEKSKRTPSHLTNKDTLGKNVRPCQIHWDSMNFNDKKGNNIQLLLFFFASESNVPMRRSAAFLQLVQQNGGLGYPPFVSKYDFQSALYLIHRVTDLLLLKALSAFTSTDPLTLHPAEPPYLPHRYEPLRPLIHRKRRSYHRRYDRYKEPS